MVRMFDKNAGRKNDEANIQHHNAMIEEPREITTEISM